MRTWQVQSLGVLLVTLVALVAVGAGPTAVAAAVALDPPVPGRVLDGFDAPDPYGPGHRGVDLAAAVGSPVRTSASGRVTFAGRVVDALWVTVDHGTLRTTVGPLRTVAVQSGQELARGAVVGTSGHAHGRPAVHWSARRGDTYVDPLGGQRTVATLVPVGLPGEPAAWWPRAVVR